MNGTLEGKVAIVTGAGAGDSGDGTGDAMSILFAQRGASVVLVDIDFTRARRTLDLIERERGQAVIYEGDVTKAADCEGAVKAAVENFGGVHILVNNVAILTPGTVSPAKFPS